MNKFLLLVMLLAILGLWSSYLRNRDAAYRNHAEATTSPAVTKSKQSVTATRDASDSTGDVDSAMQLVSTSNLDATSSDATIPAAREKQTFDIKGLKPTQSAVHVAVFESEAGFPKPERSSQSFVITGSGDQVSFSLELPPDLPIAVAVFQDIDGNGSLSRNTIGIPTEPYGFSNNARGSFGPPSFRQAAITLRNDNKHGKPIEIQVR